MTTVILVVWTVVGFAGTQFQTHEKMGWKPIGEFRSEQHCQKAAADLGFQPKDVRCLDTGRRA